MESNKKAVTGRQEDNTGTPRSKEPRAPHDLSKETTKKSTQLGENSACLNMGAATSSTTEKEASIPECLQQRNTHKTLC